MKNNNAGNSIKSLSNLSKLNKLNNINNLVNNNNNVNKKMNNSVNKSSNKRTLNLQTGKSGKALIIVASILLVIILVVCGYLLYKYFTKKKKLGVKSKNLINYIHDASMEKRFNYGSLPISAQGNEYNMNFWIYINDYKSIQECAGDICVVYKGTGQNGSFKDSTLKDSTNINGNPGIWLLKGENTLRINIGLDTNYSDNTCTTPLSASAGAGAGAQCVGSTDGKSFNTFDLKHFPLQRWINLNVSLRDNILDVFINGELHKSNILSGSATINNGDLYVCRNISSHGGFNGYISKFVYTNKALSSNEIYKKYKQGPLVNIKSSIMRIFSIFS